MRLTLLLDAVVSLGPRRIALPGRLAPGRCRGDDETPDLSPARPPRAVGDPSTRPQGVSPSGSPAPAGSASSVGTCLATVACAHPDRGEPPSRTFITMRLARWLSLAAVLQVFALNASDALAHGPCGCLFPTLTKSGARVSITQTPAYRVLFNPKPDQLGIAPKDLATAYRPRSPTVTLLSRPRKKPIRRTSFRIPSVPPGVYMVLIFDGSEGGAHNTWDYLHVLGPAPAADQRPPATAPSSSAPASSDGTAWLAWLAGGIALGIGGALLYNRRALKRRR